MRREETIKERLGLRMSEARAILDRREEENKPLYGATQYYEILKEIALLFWVLGLPQVYGWKLEDFETELKKL
ncbi:MAG: hypothetical protein V3U92_19490 [Cellulophaga sp.]